jgi:hypothetical protein
MFTNWLLSSVGLTSVEAAGFAPPLQPVNAPVPQSKNSVAKNNQNFVCFNI